MVNDPLASWIESNLGLRNDSKGRDRNLSPEKCLARMGIAAILNNQTGLAENICANAIAQTLFNGYNITNADTGMSSFAFRLHQFFNRGDTVYTSIEKEDERHITIHGQKFVPGDRSRSLLPLVFCRECGQEYYVVRRIKDSDTKEPCLFHASFQTVQMMRI